MMEVLKQLDHLITLEGKKKTLSVFMIIIISATLEVAGVALIFPFISIISNPDIVHQNEYLNFFYNMAGAQSITQFNIIIGFIVIAVVALNFFIKAVAVYKIIEYSYGTLHSVSTRAVNIFIKQKYEFYLDINTANISRMIVSEIETVVSKLILPLIRLISNGIIVVLMVAYLVYVDVYIAVATFIVLVVGSLSVYSILKQRVKRLGRERLSANTDRYVVLNEAFGGIKEIRLLGNEDTFLTRYSRASQLYSKSHAAAATLSAVPMFALQGLAVCGGVMIVLYLLHSAGSINNALPTISVFAYGAYRLMPSLQAMFSDATQVHYSRPALDTVHWDITNKINYMIDDSLDDAPALIAEKEIELKKISYTYSSVEERALSDINMHISPGSSVGIVGRSGAGKSTLVDILLGLLIATEGEVLIDGKPLEERDMRRWQKSLGYVPQSIFLADDTISANIAFGVPAEEIDKDALILAAKRAQLHDFIMDEMPKGYETIVGERGIRLSGGQKQRVAIARALYRKPRTVIFDEATSALDNETEAAVLATLQSLHGIVTVIMIAHRLSTVKNCEDIYVLEKGKLVGHGNFEYLENHNKKFKELLSPSIAAVDMNLRH